MKIRKLFMIAMSALMISTASITGVMASTTVEGQENIESRLISLGEEEVNPFSNEDGIAYRTRLAPGQTISTSYLSMDVGDTFTLGASWSPTNISLDTTFVWDDGFEEDGPTMTGGDYSESFKVWWTDGDRQKVEITNNTGVYVTVYSYGIKLK